VKTVFLVQQDEADTARRIEEILLSLPEDSGILFVSASVAQDPLVEEGRKILYRVVVGCSRTMNTDLVVMMARSYLHREFQDNSQLTFEVYRGTSRSRVTA
jgi:hypothetical protein